jgi:hypothetical protein
VSGLLHFLALLTPPKRRLPEAFETTFEKAQGSSLRNAECHFALRIDLLEAGAEHNFGNHQTLLNRDKKSNGLHISQS